MAKIMKIEASLVLDGKTRPITSGYRPTLWFSGQKALCNFDRAYPDPLPAKSEGLTTIRLSWEWPGHYPVVAGATFLAFEGPKPVGQGNVLRIL